jgi:hypothetical protein
MQVLSQLSYNPTIGPLIGAAIGRHSGRVLGPAARRASSTLPIAGLHHPGSLQIGRQRVLLPRQRVRAEL